MSSEAPLSRRFRLLAAICLASLTTLAASPASAQIGTTPDVQKGDRVEVTGSNIRRAQSETASPVEVITREELDRSGKTSVAAYLQTLAVDNAGSVPTSFGNGFSRSGSGISLRGLGVGATLVLVNGRRVAPFPLADDGTKTYTDLNIIPLEAVDRVEILKDGGSAIYGSDAIAGVVNIILKSEFNGTQLRASVGQSLEYGDARDTKLTITSGFGNLDTDKFNIFGNLEYEKKEPIFYSNRTDRGRIGRTDLRTDGFNAVDATGIAASGGTGAITLNNAGLPTGGGSSINGNVRDPFAGTYNGTAFGANTVYFSRGNTSATNGFTRQFPGAACSNFTTHPQGDPGGGCLTDVTQEIRSLAPKSEQYNFYGRGTWQVLDNLTAYAEGNYYDNRSSFLNTPSVVSSTTFSPTIINTPQATLGANHPDNPYFGTAARLRYTAYDVGPRRLITNNQFSRFLAGVKGTVLGWDFDTAASYSRDKLQNSAQGFLQIDVLNALLNPTAANVATARANSAAYAALPANTYYRIGENAGLNTPAVYAALTPTVQAFGKSEEAFADFKASRELFALPGGNLGFAIGTEVRHEQNSLTPSTGTPRANTLGLGYSAYGLSRNIEAIYAEAIAPVFKGVELSAAGRYDHYEVVGGAFTPKGGIKWNPIDILALRGTFSKGFRAPNAPEATGSVTASATSADPVRCALGVASACSASTVAFISQGSSTLAPEHSKVYTGGFVLDPTRNSSVSADYFKIVRKNEIVAGSGTNESAVLRNLVVRDPTTTQAGIANDPGVLVAIVAPFQNSSFTQVRGADIEGRQAIPLGEFGKLSLGLRYTHLFSYEVVDLAGNVTEYANTHGNCNVSNCVGTPADRANADVTYSFGPVVVSTIINFRGGFRNRETQAPTQGCEEIDHTGANNPNNCRIGSFTTFDLTARYTPIRNTEVFGTIQNLFDRVPPFDPTTYGAVGYNPLDYSGAVGRFFMLGARVKF